MNKSKRTLPIGSTPKKLKFEYQPFKSVPGSAPGVYRPAVGIEVQEKPKEHTNAKSKENPTRLTNN